MVNYEFELSEWIPRIPLEPETSDPDRYSASIVTSPCQLCCNEQLRKEIAAQVDWGPAIPVDVFVMAKGEPADRHATKVGGLPYRPRHLAWPRLANGEPLTFVAQFCFADSKDLVGDLPGEVLSFFAESEESIQDVWWYEWHPLGLTGLAGPDDVPETNWRIAPCYGYRCRTSSYPFAKRKPEYQRQQYLRCHGGEVWQDYHLFEYQAMQIGEAPFYVQGAPGLPGRSLCAISCVAPAPLRPYPWINQAEPLYSSSKVWLDDVLAAPESRHDGLLQLTDAGCVYLSIDEKQKLHLAYQFY